MGFQVPLFIQHIIYSAWGCRAHTQGADGTFPYAALEGSREAFSSPGLVRLRSGHQKCGMPGAQVSRGACQESQGSGTEGERKQALGPGFMPLTPSCFPALPSVWVICRVWEVAVFLQEIKPQLRSSQSQPGTC